MKDTLISLYVSGQHHYLASTGGGGTPAEPVTGVPTPGMKAPGDLANAVNTVLGIAAWAGTAAGVGGIIITGIMMAVSMKRGEGSEHFSRLGMVLGGCVLVSTAGPTVQFLF